MLCPKKSGLSLLCCRASRIVILDGLEMFVGVLLAAPASVGNVAKLRVLTAFARSSRAKPLR